MSGEIFMFDTMTKTWTKGISGQPRAYATCTIAGNQLLIWGGMNADRTVASGDVMIYNMENDKWVTNYSPPAWYLDPSATTTASGSDPSSTQSSGEKDGNGGNVGAIVGGVVGGLALIAGVLFIFFRRRKEHRRRNDSVAVVNDDPKPHSSNNSDSSSAVEKLHAAGYGDLHGKSRKEEKEEIQTLRDQLQAQRVQQADLQRQVEELKIQHSYDAVYGYQPPIYYPPGTSSLVPTQPEIFKPSSEQGPVIYNPTTSPPPIPRRIPVTTEVSSGSVSAMVPGSLPFSQTSTLARSPEGLIQSEQQQPAMNQGIVRSPEGLIQSEQQQSTALYQDLNRDGTGARPNNPHTPVTNSGRPHTIVP
ncbi:hypothetical protein BGZ96_012043 [Linnemannia gamsii]|uniref:Galactose oxidase n=1 Tax=Linnemannia gamsii TaxID=64522 RepID=A0ABQ7JRU6_9FUNG|nr:hypothetical protein BGZ96_012043 [Linnemannia gamsii]